MVSAQDWEHIREGKKPLPGVSTGTYRVESILLGVAADYLPQSIRRTWLEEILVRTLTGGRCKSYALGKSTCKLFRLAIRITWDHLYFLFIPV